MGFHQIWTSTRTHLILEQAARLFTATLLDLGGIKISLSFIANLVAQSIVVFIVANLVKRVTKNRILPRFGLDLGTREALASIISYLIISIGFFVVIQNIGVKLETLAVVLGAIGFTLSFGLQGLASDLAGGITLLLEQPIKIGDFIELEEVAGTVENIAIRSTIVRTTSGKAIVLSNTAITTKNIINWSYQTEQCGIEITIRIPRGHAPLVVMEVLLRAVRKELKVLTSPPPKIYLKGIDDDFLNFEIRAWINQPQEADAVKSALYFLVEAELQATGLGKTPDQGQGDISPTFNYAALGDLLRQVSYFTKLNDTELRCIIEEGYRKTLNANEIICRENDPGDSFYIILSGSVDVYIDSIDKHVAVRQTGEFIGEMSLLMDTPRSATLQTLEETTLFVVDRRNLKNLLQKQQGLADRISEELAQRQESLEKLGIKLEMNNKETALVQIRKRIQSIFGI